MLFDTEFLIALSGQRGRIKKAAAEAFLTRHSGQAFTSRVNWAELAEGYESAADMQAAASQWPILEIDEDVAWIASRVARNLKGRGLHIGDNDIWIAAIAIHYDMELVTNNAAHFSRIPNLKILAY